MNNGKIVERFGKLSTSRQLKDSLGYGEHSMK